MICFGKLCPMEKIKKNEEAGIRIREQWCFLIATGMHICKDGFPLTFLLLPLLTILIRDSEHYSNIAIM